MAKQRLQKVLAAAGVGSRRKCEELSISGAVQVNRKIVNKLPSFVDPEKDIITVNGKRISVDSARRTRKVYFLLHKPKGVICTSSDPLGRKKTIDFIPTDSARRFVPNIFCVGRLDADTTGIIILTNDSELANKLTHPKYEVPKTYVAQIKGQISGVMVEKLKKGIWLAEGKTSRASVKVLKRDHKESSIEITIRQGLNRQVRRMLAKVGLPVRSLKRTRIGTLTARGLGMGKFRTLSIAEIEYLKSFDASLGRTQGRPVRQARGRPVRQAQGRPVRQAQDGKAKIR